MAELYKKEGNSAYGKKDLVSAIDFYTQGINMKCKDDELNAKLYSNRATAYFHQGKVFFGSLLCLLKQMMILFSKRELFMNVNYVTFQSLVAFSYFSTIASFFLLP